MNVDFGCGNHKVWGAIGIDQFPVGSVDCVANVETAIPVSDNSVTEAYAYHFLEHCVDPVRVLEEFWRVVRSSGRLHLRVPHASTPSTAWSDMTHKRGGFATSSFEYFLPENKGDFPYTRACFRILHQELRINLGGDQPSPQTIPQWFRKFVTLRYERYCNQDRLHQVRAERWFSNIIGFQELYVILQPMKENHDAS